MTGCDDVKVKNLSVYIALIIMKKAVTMIRCLFFNQKLTF